MENSSLSVSLIVVLSELEFDVVPNGKQSGQVNDNSYFYERLSSMSSLIKVLVVPHFGVAARRRRPGGARKGISPPCARATPPTKSGQPPRPLLHTIILMVNWSHHDLSPEGGIGRSFPPPTNLRALILILMVLYSLVHSVILINQHQERAP